MNFTSKELERWIDNEICLIRYYGFWVDRWNLNTDSDIYKDVKPIEYCKKQMSLYNRCSVATITSDKIITIDSKIEELYTINDSRKENTYTPIELYLILYPDKKDDLIDIIKSKETNPKTDIFLID